MFCYVTIPKVYLNTKKPAILYNPNKYFIRYQVPDPLATEYWGINILHN
ncbi:uncharacterized protein METZ01_LOCUS349283, partial [marine metagenome]